MSGARIVEKQNDFALELRAVKAKVRLVIHVVLYVLVNALLFGINVYTSGRPTWFWYPLLGWGFGLMCHAIATSIVLKTIPEMRRQAKLEL